MSVLFTLAVAPVYLLIRQPFRRLPLHIDSGFYVSNHTIATGRFRFSKGWNAHYAGCSKLIPEVFYSLVYLLHGRGDDERCADGYKRKSRLYASLYNYATAIAVGILAYYLSGGQLVFYLAGLATFALLSSEAHYGVFDECAEWFELLFDVVAVTLLIVGLSRGEGWYVGSAAFVWALGTFFVKLSSGIGFAILFGGVVLLHPETLLPVMVGGASASMLFAAFLIINGRNPIALLRSLRGHEASYDQWANWRGVLHRYTEKLGAVVSVVRRQPVIPVLAVVGLVIDPPQNVVFWLFAASATVTYFAQATDCRYYLIPLLPALAVSAAGGVAGLIALGPVGGGILVAMFVVWIIHNPLRAARAPTDVLNRWCWAGSMAQREVDQNLSLDRAARTLRPMCRGESLLVYGPRNQACVLIGAGYETPIVAPEFYLDDVCPGWERSHNERLVSTPPVWILDTSRTFAAAVARSSLGLDYRLTHWFGDQLQVYHLEGVTPAATGFQSARTFQAVSREQLEHERSLAGASLTVHALDAEDATNFSTDREALALSALLTDLSARGFRRLAVYGAGRFTIRHADLYRNSAVPVTVVLDDNAERSGDRFLDWPVKSPAEVSRDDFDAVIVSTDRFVRPMLAQLRRRWGETVQAFTVAT